MGRAMKLIGISMIAAWLALHDVAQADGAADRHAQLRPPAQAPAAAQATPANPV